jgi:HlyD family secretion protein
MISACRAPSADTLHGYVEGEFVYISAQLPGTVTLQVAKGITVKQGEPLFSLESVAELTARDEAQRRLTQAQALLQDLGKGARPTEIAALQARLQEAKDARSLGELEFVRAERLMKNGTVSVQDFDRAKSVRDQQQQLVTRLEAELQSARLGGRSDQLAAAAANVRALEAVAERTRWDLSRKSLRAPVGALVFDTLYRSGEFVPAGRPVVALLPPANIKVRVFVPEARLAAIHPNDPVSVTVDGTKETFSGRVSYISPRAEYTPPVIYSRESRDKLVFMVEAAFAPEVAVRLHPGQPVDLRFGK